VNPGTILRALDSVKEASVRSLYALYAADRTRLGPPKAHPVGAEMPILLERVASTGHRLKARPRQDMENSIVATTPLILARVVGVNARQGKTRQ
jgi:hypothetical protein